MEVFVQAVLLVLNLVMLQMGTYFLVEASVGLGNKSDIPQLAVGLTVIAMGTSAPEAMVSITSALEGNAVVTVGNIVGSNILNVLLILGLPAIIASLKIQPNTVWYEIPTTLFVTVMLLIAGVRDNNIGRLGGVLFLLVFIVYLAYLFLLSTKDRRDKALQEVEAQWTENTLVKHPKTSVLLLKILVGLILLVTASNIVTDTVTSFAIENGVDDCILGFSIIALGTSLPELFTTVYAVKKGYADIAVGNIIGSCIFNILFVIGTVALITPVVFMPEFTIDTCIAMAVILLLFFFVYKKKILKRKHGILMLGFYVVYLIYQMFGFFE